MDDDIRHPVLAFLIPFVLMGLAVAIYVGNNDHTYTTVTEPGGETETYKNADVHGHTVMTGNKTVTFPSSFKVVTSSYNPHKDELDYLLTAGEGSEGTSFKQGKPVKSTGNLYSKKSDLSPAEKQEKEELKEK